MSIKSTVFKSKNILLSGALASALLVGCGDGSDEGNTPPQEDDKPKTEMSDDGRPSRLIPAGKKVFSIPSPLQLSLLIKETGQEYDASLLHDINSAESYADVSKMAFNVGVYGADLGYTSIYNYPQDAIGYMKTVKKLTDKLEITEAFDTDLVQAIERNLENKDSLLSVISNSYKDADAYLKANKREDVGAMILTGGWVESMYFATRVVGADKNEKVRLRIGEQKKALDNILNILVKYYNKPGVSDVYNSLEELYDIFQEVQITYTYEKPVIDVDNRHTTISSKTNVTFTEETFQAIAKKTDEVRNLIIK